MCYNISRYYIFRKGNVMQLIGIYLETHKNPVSKNLKENWYPFGNFDNCHGVKDFSNILKQVKENQTFINKFYNIRQGSGENKPSINLNCIVGKNGSGKSSVLSLLYRIMNNLACKLKEVLPDFNKDYSPMWAWGFNAKLYYEIDEKIGCVEIFDNDKPTFTEERTGELPVRLTILDAEGNKEEILSRTPERIEEEKDLLEKLGKSIFYTIGTNYSLYTNSVVRFDYDESQESWMSTIYHKNDGYFTPIVLVPYRNYNGKNSIIDTEKELRLANERVNTLAILLKASDGSDFIEGFLPEKVVYELKDERAYRKEIKNKIEKLCPDDCKKNDFNKTADELKDFIGWEWKNQFKNEKILGTDSSDLENEELKKIIFNNILCYLSYKTIKICIYYDRYKNHFKENGNNVFDSYITNREDCKRKIKVIISNISNDTEPTDFINLKIKQCIEFLRNGAFYLEKIGDEDGISIKEIIEEIENKNKKNLTYDSVFLKLLPPVFKKKYVYKKIGSDDEMTISQMSSGEQQMLYSLSYAVYHMKNAASNHLQLKKGNNLISIPYKNMNLIFDEAELYYHPEYQRQFIDKLLGILKRSHFEKDIDSINITIVTHSPFMLSDIPDSNILALNNGKRDTTFESKTLGANIYDLLSNQFFMESAIGAHVEKIINEIIDDYNGFKKIIDNKSEDKNDENQEKLVEKYKNENNENFYAKFAKEIGDEYLREVIQDMILQMQGKDYRERKIESYNRKIKQLENKK